MGVFKSRAILFLHIHHTACLNIVQRKVLKHLGIVATGVVAFFGCTVVLARALWLNTETEDKGYYEVLV
jgi:hypothetical protein